MKVGSGSIMVLAVAGCAAPDASVDLCDVAQQPSDFIGREISITDVVIVDGHAEPILVPNGSCPEFVWFPVERHELEPLARQRFLSLARSLNRTTVNGSLAGLAGTYRLRVLRQKEAGVLNVS